MHRSSQKDTTSSHVDGITDTTREDVSNHEEISVEDSIMDSLYDSLPGLSQWRNFTSARESSTSTVTYTDMPELEEVIDEPHAHSNSFIPIGVNL